MGTITVFFFHCAGKYSCDKLRSKIHLSSGANIMEQPFMIKLGVPSGPTDLQALRLLIVFKMFNSEMGSKCKKLLDSRPDGGPAGVAVL
jgi:hypothetical protein